MEHLYIVTYDISDDRRWRRIFKTMKGYGEWLQLSVFQCRLSKIKALRMEAALSEIVNHAQDHILIVDLGPADSVKPHVKTIGGAFDPIERKPIIV